MKNILRKTIAVATVLLCILQACFWPGATADDNILVTYEIDTIGFVNKTAIVDTAINPVHADSFRISSRIYPAAALVSFSKTLLGIPYQYGSADPAVGFDCSGFISYVYNHFNIKVPRSSVEFTNRGITVPADNAVPGDLILFTGTDSTSGIVGHMGIVVENTDSLRFIHSSSGKANGVTITALNAYYNTRLVKVISIKNGL